MRKVAPSSGLRRTEALAGYMLSLPAFILMWAMLLGPAVSVVLLSLTDWNFGEASLRWAGLENYVELWSDRVFWISLKNTIIYVGISVPATVILGLLAALLIESVAHGKAFYRAAFFVPVASTLLAMALVWEFMFHPTVGFINQLFAFIGLPTADWLQNPGTALFALIAIGVWQNLACIIHQELADVVYPFEISYDFAVESQNPRIRRPHPPCRKLSHLCPACHLFLARR